MTGYSWISIVALFCYLFLFLTFLTSKKTDKEIRSFMMLMVIMILWVGGSFAMRMQMWPAVNFWHHVSLLGMMLLASGYYYFVLDFLEEKNGHNKRFWMVFHLLLFVVNCFTGLFIPEPVVETTAGATQFIYTYSWHIYILFVFILLCVVQMVAIIARHCKGNHIAFQQLKPIIIGISILLVGHVAATLPMFTGVPLDILSGTINALFVFYALYKKRLFKMTLLLSKSNYFVFAMVVGAIVSYESTAPLQRFFQKTVGMSYTGSVVAISVVLVLLVIIVYAVVTLSCNAIFVRNERRQQERIERFGEEINHTLSVSDILQNMTDTIQETTHMDRMVVFMRQADGDFRVEHTTNPLDEKSFYIRADHPLVTYFKSHSGSISLREFARSTVYRSMWEKEKQLLQALRADYFIPLLCDEGLVGIIVLPQRKDKAPYHPNDLQAAHTIAVLCATSVKDASVYERAIDEARKDKLTGLANRKFFFELLDREFERFKDTALSLCLLNLDDFKLYNQMYGTQEGDIALQRVAGLLQASLNEVSFAARIGGKEFALILPGYDIYSAKLMTENLVAEIGEINNRNGGQVASRLTVSAGICAAPYMASSARELFQNAETAVYTVKRSGKNAVQIYSSEIYHQEAQQYKHSSGYRENASTIYALTAAIDAKDHYTFQHSKNVAYYASELAKAAGLERDLVEIVKEAGLLHDIGKIGIREDILNKPGKLNLDEYEIMKGHVENAVNIIRDVPSLDYVIPTVLSHHERYDGRGYPRRLAGEEIPVMGRILCIADSFDAMTSVRSYKDAMSADEAVKILREEAGKQFDPKLVLIFIELILKNKVEIRGQRAGEEPSPYDGDILSAIGTETTT